MTDSDEDMFCRRCRTPSSCASYGCGLVLVGDCPSPVADNEDQAATDPNWADSPRGTT